MSEEIKTILRNLGSKALIEKGRRLAAVSTEEKRTYIFERGWIDFSDPEFGTFYKNKKEGIHGVMLIVAYEMAFQNEQSAKRKEELAKWNGYRSLQ
jgi:hypothetical protein